MHDVAQSAKTIGNFLQAFTASSGLRLRYRVKLRSSKQDNGEPQNELESDAGEGAGPRTLAVEFSGPDTPVLTANNAELLNALEHIAAKILRLEPESHDQVLFDADHFKANRERTLRESAATAVQRVRETGQPHPFPAMSSRERRLLHLILRDSGLPTASSGEGAGRYVVLYPEGMDISERNFDRPPQRQRDASHIRSAFRHR